MARGFRRSRSIFKQFDGSVIPTPTQVIGDLQSGARDGGKEGRTWKVRIGSSSALTGIVLTLEDMPAEQQIEGSRLGDRK